MRFKVAWTMGSWKNGTSGSVLGASTPICRMTNHKKLGFIMWQIIYFHVFTTASALTETCLMKTIQCQNEKNKHRQTNKHEQNQNKLKGTLTVQLNRSKPDAAWQFHHPFDHYLEYHSIVEHNPGTPAAFGPELLPFYLHWVTNTPSHVIYVTIFLTKRIFV